MSYFIRRSKKNVSISALLLICLFGLVACSSKSSEKSIKNVQWQWTAMEETEPSSISLVPDSMDYTLLLNADDSFELKADCNIVLGTYALEGNSISFQMGPSQMAYCGDDSLDLQYLNFLGQIESFNLDAGKLILNLMDGAGMMTFEST